MNESKTILAIVLVSILLIYVLFFMYLMYAYVMPKKNTQISENKITVNKIQKSYNNTDFYNKSLEHINKVLFENLFDSQYGENGYCANNLLNVLGKLNDETKKSIVVAINYLSIEPSSSMANENNLRHISEQEKVPLWFIILREATKKVIPEFSDSLPHKSNVIPLYKVA